MTTDMIIVLVALICAVILFATELLRVDVVAVLIMATLMLTGVLSPEEGLGGFSNAATATVAAMFVLSAAVERTGIMIPVARRMEMAFQKNFWLGFLFMILIAGLFSAFVNNTPVVALLIPVVIVAASKAGISPSKLLIPLSFVSMFGGVCTLVGTSTNILVSDVSAQYGFGAWGMFEVTRLGLVFFMAGTLYMIFIGLRLLPDYGKTVDLDKEFHISSYLTNIQLKKEALDGNRLLGDIPLIKDHDVEVIQLTRGDRKFSFPSRGFEVQENDILKIKCNVEKIKQLREKKWFEIKPLLTDEMMHADEQGLHYVEAIISPGSSLVGRQFREIDFRSRYKSALLGIRERQGLFSRLMRHERIVSGDTLLLAVEKANLQQLKRESRDFVLIAEPRLSDANISKGVIALSIVAMVILLASLNILPILVAAIFGCILMLLTRCIDAEQAYRSVDWKVIFLLAGAMSFGVALRKTGLADYVAGHLASLAGDYGPIVLLSVIYLLTSLLTEAMSNNATVVLLAPVVIAMAETLGISSKPFLMAITFAASSSFMTPIGYQTNTMVYAAGNYRFRDFFKVGLWLNLLFWILATFLIPVFFPF
jgi:di/tricarboxylate transporter